MSWTILQITVFILGLCLGSFLNVVIYRLPRPGLSISQPRRSACPKCQNLIAWYDNLPLISYLVLGGRCRHCHSGISLRYPAVELMCGVLVLAVFSKYGFSLRTPFMIYLVLALVAVTFIDLDLMLIPDEITVPGMILGLAASVISPHTELIGPWLGIRLQEWGAFSRTGLVVFWALLAFMSVVAVFLLAVEVYFLILARKQSAAGLENPAAGHEENGPEEMELSLDLVGFFQRRWLISLIIAVLLLGIPAVVFGPVQTRLTALEFLRELLLTRLWTFSLFGSLLGFITGWFLIWALITGYFKLTGREGMGGGDLTLLAMIGAFLGWRSIFMTIFFGAFLALGAYLVLAAREKSFDLKAVLPFGPFLSLAALIYLFFGQSILNWYLG